MTKKSKFLFYVHNGEPEIVPEEAETIRMIYQSYLDGSSLVEIKNTLEKKEILTPTGKKEWKMSVIMRILQNEKYMGDVLLQKTYVDDFLEGTKKQNCGELPKDYIENNHHKIIYVKDINAASQNLPDHRAWKCYK